jgi:hypothetical protein
VVGNGFSLYIHTYHSRFIHDGLAEISQVFLRDTHVLPKSVRNTADVTGGKPIALLQFILGVSAINPLVAFYIHGGKRGAILFCPGHTRHRALYVSHKDDEFKN